VTATVKRFMSTRAKKLRSILRDHYTREDLSESLIEVLEDARYLCKQRGLSFSALNTVAGNRAFTTTEESKK
jgi:hypothetical protein